MNFENFNIKNEILKALTEEGYKKATLVQEKSLINTLKGKDVIVQSQTGTGKTAAFVIPIINSFMTNKTKALIIAPTRELVIQIEKEAQKIAKYSGMNTVAIFGGEDYSRQLKKLNEDAELVIATPGRLMDFAKSKDINLKEFSFLVLDEADRMLDMGFQQDINWIISRMKAREERQTMLFSATLTSKTRQLAWGLLNEPVEIEIEPENIVIDKIEQSLYHVCGEEKFPLLLGLLKRENPGSAIIFTNTKHETENISRRLNANGYKTQYIIGDLPQNRRTKIIERVKNKQLDVLVATDVAARGLHINELDLVINYDLPEDYENYVHRIGRTARAGSSGKSISLACPRFVYGLQAIEEYIGMKIPVEFIEDNLLIEDKGKYSAPKRKTPQKGPQKSSQKSSQKVTTAQKKQPNKSTHTKKPVRSRKPVSAMSEKERLDFYARKYGESFKVAEQASPKKKPATSKPTKQKDKKRKSFFKRLFKKS